MHGIDEAKNLKNIPKTSPSPPKVRVLTLIFTQIFIL